MKKNVQLLRFVKTTFDRVSLAVALALSVNFINAQCPQLGSIGGVTGPLQSCPGLSNTYTVTAVTNATDYTWYLPSGCNINGQNPYTSSSTTVTVNFGPFFVPPGNISVYASNACFTTGPLTKTITSAGVPGGASSISGNFFACPGTTNTYSVTNIAQRIFTWSVPTGASILSGQGTNQITVQFNAGFVNNGTLSVNVSNGCGTSPSQLATIYVDKPLTPGTISGPTTVCAGQSGVFSVQQVANVTSYTWSAPIGATITGQGTNTVTITMPAGFTVGNVGVKANNGCGVSKEKVLQIRSAPNAPASITGIAAGLCNGVAQYSVPVLPGVTGYNWTTLAPASIIAGQNTPQVDINFLQNYNTGRVCVTSTNACGTGLPRCLQLTKVIDIPVQPTATEVCDSTSAMFTVSAIGLNLNYQWRLNGVNLVDGPNVSGATTNTLTINQADISYAGNYDVKVTNSCNPNKVSSVAPLTIKYKPVTPGAITGGSQVTCPGTTGVQYSIPLQPDAFGYDWFGSDGVSIASGQGSEVVLVDFSSMNNTGYYINVRALNECGTSDDSSHVWTRYSVSTPAIVTGPAKVCNNLPNITYATQNVAGASTYNWTPPAGATIASGQGTNSVVIDFGPTYNGGNILVNASTHCYTSTNKIFATSIDMPGIPTTLTGQIYSACNTTLTYAAGTSNSATSYSWTLPPNATIGAGAGTNTVDISFGNPGNSNLCVSGVNYCRTSAPRCIPLKGFPQTPGAITANPSSFCKNQAGVVFTIPANPVAGTIDNWIVPSGSSIVSGQGTTSITVNMGAQNGNVTCSGSNACGSSGSSVLAVVMPCRNGNNEIAEDEHVKTILYPNPAKEKVALMFNTDSDESYSIKVFDILGKQVIAEGGISKRGANQHEINIHALSKGVYIVSLSSASSNEKLKLEVR